MMAQVIPVIALLVVFDLWNRLPRPFLERSKLLTRAVVTLAFLFLVLAELIAITASYNGGSRFAYQLLIASTLVGACSIPLAIITRAVASHEVRRVQRRRTLLVFVFLGSVAFGIAYLMHLAAVRGHP